MQTKSRLDGVEDCGLHKRTPYGIMGVTQTQLSIARFYGGITFQGDQYTYFPDTDELVRDDVLKWQTKRNKKARKPNPQ